MKAQITDNFDLVLRWNDEARCEITWTPCSKSEFEVSGKFWFAPALNYQGSTKLEFSTTCYASSLLFFADELEAFTSGKKASVTYRGSEDMEITLEEQRGQASAKDRKIMVSVLKYAMFRSIELIGCETVFECVLGRMEEPGRTASAIRDVISVLQMDSAISSDR